MRSSRQERQKRGQVLQRRFRRSGSRDRLSIIPSPRVGSAAAGSAVGRRRNGVLELASSSLKLLEPVLNYWLHVLELANESLDSDDG